MARIKPNADPKEIAKEEEKIMLGKKLIIASSRNELEAVKTLLGKGADVNYRNIHNETPILAACEGGALEVLQFLFSKGGQLELKSASDQHPIHNACASGNEAVVKWLVQHGQSLTVQAYDGSTPLHVATRQGQADVVKWLLGNKTCNINKQDFAGLTPGHIAGAMPRRRPVLDLLIAGGANLNKESFRGDTVLHLAARKADPETLVYLIEHGAKIGCPSCNKDGKSCESIDAKVALLLRSETAKYKAKKKDMKKVADAEKKGKKAEDNKDKARTDSPGETRPGEGPPKKGGFFSGLLSKKDRTPAPAPATPTPTSSEANTAASGDKATAAAVDAKPAAEPVGGSGGAGTEAAKDKKKD